MRRLLPALLLLALPQLARAEESTLEQAKAAFEGGKTAYAAGRYDAAIAAFTEAQRLAPRPAIVFSLAQAHRLQYFVDKRPPRLLQAVELYRRYLAEEPRGPRREDAVGHLAALEPLLARVQTEVSRAAMVEEAKVETQLMVSTNVSGAVASIDGATPLEVPVLQSVTPGPHKVRISAPGYFDRELERIAVEGRLVVIDADLEEIPARLSFEVPAGAEVSIGGRPLGSAPFGGPVPLAAGRYFVSVTKSGAYPAATELELTRGEDARVAVQLETTTQRVIAYAALGTAGGLLVAGGAAAAAALVAQGEATDIRAKLDRGQNLTLGDVAAYDAAVERRDRLRGASIGLLAGCGAVALTGALLYAFDHRRPESGPSFQISPVGGPGAAGAALSGRF